MNALIIDDERMARQELKRLLSAHPDIEIVGEAVTGKQALELIPRLALDVIFLDVQMPGMNGFELLEHLDDVPQEVLRAGPKRPREEAGIVFGEPCHFERWPEIPIHVVAGRDDRFFPIEFQRRIARERLGKEVEEIAGGHLLALSNPQGLAARLLAQEKRLNSSSSRG